MAQQVKEVMSRKPITLRRDDTVKQAASAMKDNDIGDVIVIEKDNKIAGIVTDRDITVRAVAEGKDPSSMKLGELISSNVETLPPDATIGDAVSIMRERAVRRIPIVENGKPVGIVALGDLAIERDERSALADVSAARGNE